MKHRHCSESETQNCAMVAVFSIIFVVEIEQKTGNMVSKTQVS